MKVSPPPFFFFFFFFFKKIFKKIISDSFRYIPLTGVANACFFQHLPLPPLKIISSLDQQNGFIDSFQALAGVYKFHLLLSDHEEGDEDEPDLPLLTTLR